jgi:hypothetical protein
MRVQCCGFVFGYWDLAVFWVSQGQLCPPPVLGPSKSGLINKHTVNIPLRVAQSKFERGDIGGWTHVPVLLRQTYRATGSIHRHVMKHIVSSLFTGTVAVIVTVFGNRDLDLINLLVQNRL